MASFLLQGMRLLQTITLTENDAFCHLVAAEGRAKPPAPLRETALAQNRQQIQGTTTRCARAGRRQQVLPAAGSRPRTSPDRRFRPSRIGAPQLSRTQWGILDN
jgi:hypothetical protein